MKKEFNERYQQVYQLAEQKGEAFAQVVSESFDDLDSLVSSSIPCSTCIPSRMMSNSLFSLG